VHVLLAALRLYLVDNTLPPTAPTLPDMHSSTTSYLALQGLYRSQFQHDLHQYRTCLLRVLSDIGLPDDAIPANEVESFVKNTNGVAVIKGRSLADRRLVGKELQEAIGMIITVGDKTDSVDDNYGLDGWPVTYGLALHLAIMAAEQFHQVQGRWPGIDPVSHDADIAEVTANVSSMVKSSDLPVEVLHSVQEVYVYSPVQS
jgi:amyloid beta precursor protein binding protein 1